MKYEETATIELKSEYKDELASEIVAFLNTHNGVIYIGIKNDGEIIGVNNIDQALIDISEIIVNGITPNPQELIKVSTFIEENKKIIKIKINKGYELFYVTKMGLSVKGCYERVGSTKRSMTHEEIQKRFISSLKPIDFLTVIPSSYKPITLNQLRIYYESLGYHLDSTTIAENLKLLTEDGKYNLLAELMSDKNRIGFIYARFHGKDKSSYGETIDHGNQCIITSLERMINRLEGENFGKTTITSKQRITKRLVDMDCLKEALFNAIINNSWESGKCPVIYKFNDRFEIISYGGLPIRQTEENFYKGISSPRSESLMRIMRDLGYAERTGHGIPKIIKLYGKKAFDINDNYIIVTLNFDEDVIDSLNEETQNESLNIENEPLNTENESLNIENEPLNSENEPLNSENESLNIENESLNSENESLNVENEPLNSENESLNTEPAHITSISKIKTLLEILKSNQKLNRDELASLLKISKSTLYRTLKKLLEEGIIIRVGSKKDGYWKIKD